MSTPTADNNSQQTEQQKVQAMLQACAEGNIPLAQSLIEQSLQQSMPPIIASLQDEKTGISPLMVAADGGHFELCKILLEYGAPWNAVDRRGKCAGNYATERQHWHVVDLLVDAGTKAELILGAAIRHSMQMSGGGEAGGGGGIMDHSAAATVGHQYPNAPPRPVDHEPCTKPDYLSHKVRYNAANTALLDQDDDAIMMEWERPLMEAHASIITGNSQRNKIVLNVGFGMGIIDTALQKLEPAMHYIIEAHPDVYRKMVHDGWDKKSNVRVCFGRWQDEMPKLMQEGVVFDGIFFDTYGEHFTDLEDFHEYVAKTLKKPGGVYSFFNGLAPDNIFFHGVACQCVKLQLAKMGLDSEFAGKQHVWIGLDWIGL